MSRLNKCKVGIFLLLLRERQWPAIFEEIRYDPQEEPLRSDIFRPYDQHDASVLSFRLIPKYFRYEVNDTDFRIKRIKQHNWGYAINLSAYQSAADYLSDHFNSSTRRGIKRFIKRLENCFDISYEIYYGELERTHYDQLMDSLKMMITTRFEEKGAMHLELPIWNTLMDKTYQQILDKEASLFVIYNNEIPIQISLNYHLDKILFSSIASFDMDYAKFGLGHVEIYKQLDWCCANGYMRYEMGVGGTDYKKRWSNHKYNFEHHILYSKKLIGSIVMAFIEITRVALKEFLKSIGVNEIHQRLYQLKHKGEIKNENLKLSSIETISGTDQADDHQMTELALDSKSLSWAKKHINNFLYSTQEQEKDIRLFQARKGSYVILGKEHHQIMDHSA